MMITVVQQPQSLVQNKVILVVRHDFVPECSQRQRLYGFHGQDTVEALHAAVLRYAEATGWTVAEAGDRRGSVR